MGVCHSSENQFNEDINKCNTDVKSPNHLNDYTEKQGSRTGGTTFQHVIGKYSEDYDNYNYRYQSTSTHSSDSSQTTTMKTSILSHDVYHHLDRIRKLSVIREYQHGNEKHENKIGPQWTKLSSVPKPETNATSSKIQDHSIYQPLMINDNEILIMPQMIKSHEDLIQIPTYLYSYNITTGRYSKFTEYPHDFPKGSHTTTVDRDKGIIYIFTEKGYVCSYNMNLPENDAYSPLSPSPISPSTSSLSLTSSCPWKWEIIHGVSAWSGHDLRNNASSAMIDNKLHIVSGKQHVVWNKNTKQLKCLDRFRIWNYAQMVYIPGQSKMLLVGSNDPDNAHAGLSGCVTTLDTLFSYSVGVNHWIKLRDTLPFGVHKFGWVLSEDERYLIMFGGRKLPDGCDYDGILIMDLWDFSVKISKVRCPIEGDLYACLCVDHAMMDKVIYGFGGEYRHCLLDNAVEILGNYYVVENVHIFNRNGGGHWKMQIDDIL